MEACTSPFPGLSKSCVLCADSLPDGITMLGPAATVLTDLGGHASADVHLQFLALKSGVMQLPDLMLSEGESKRLLDTLSLNVLVE